MNVLLVALGGFLGSITRYYLSVKANKRLVGTWTANITGAILLAILLRLYSAGSVNEWLWIFAGTGFCGAYTTFSTFGNETLQLMLDKQYITAISYVVSSLAVSMFCVFVILNI